MSSDTSIGSPSRGRLLGPERRAGDASDPSPVASLLPGIVAMVLLGSSVAVIGGIHGQPTFWVQAWRYAAAAATIALISRLTGRRLVLPRPTELPFVIAGAGLGLVGFNLALIVGSRHAEPAVLGAAVSCIPIVLAVAGPLTRGGRPSGRLVAGAVVVAAGAVLVSGWGRTDAIGLLAAAVLIALEAGFTLVGAPVLPRLGAWSFSAGTCAVAALSFGAIAAVTEPSRLIELRQPGPILSIVYLGVIATAISFVLWFGCVQRIGAGSAGLASGVAAPASALIGIVVGGPIPGPAAWAGMVLIMVGLLVAHRTAGRRRSGRMPVGQKPTGPMSAGRQR
ncbi:DMT family transporter [Microlunatus soli]|nr:DMT family transporter [Microlunatus soli]